MPSQKALFFHSDYALKLILSKLEKLFYHMLWKQFLLFRNTKKWIFFLMFFGRKLFECVILLWIFFATSHWLLTHFLSHFKLKILDSIISIPKIRRSSADKFTKVFISPHLLTCSLQIKLSLQMRVDIAFVW